MGGHINDLQHSKFNSEGDVKTAAQDQTTPMIIVPFHNTAVTSTVAVAPLVKEDYTLEVLSIAGFLVGQYLTIYSIASNRFYQGTILSIASNVITTDTQIDFEYQIGDNVSGGSIDMNVNGAITPKIFNIRLPEPGLSIIGDITRILLVMETTTEPGWNEFGDIVPPAGFRGIALRKVDGTYQNIFTAKSNSDLANIMFDFDPIDQAKFSVYGLKGRLTFKKLGVAVRLALGEDIQNIVQSDLSTLLKFRIYAQGHLTDPT